MLFGGANEKAVYNNSMVAGRKSYRIAVNPTDMGGYTFGGGWNEEDMGFARVLAEVVLLPNGHMIIMNGAQVGGWVGREKKGGGLKLHGRGSRLQHCCTVLYCIVMYCVLVLHYTALSCNIYCPILYPCSVLYCIIMYL